MHGFHAIGSKVLFGITFLGFSLSALAFSPTSGPTTGEPAQAAPQRTAAFTNVNVVPMDSERVLEDQVVVIEDGLISAVGPKDEVTIPDSVAIVDGQGGYLMPGLADMHMHIQINSTYNDPEQLLFYLSQGTTTVRSLGTAPEAYPWREQIARGELIGPTLYTAGRTIVGNYDDEIGLGLYMTLLNVLRLVLPLILGGIGYLVFKPLRNPRIATVGGGALVLVGLVLLLTRTPPFMILAPAFDRPSAYVPENVEQAKAELPRQQEWDVDAVKVYDGLSEEQYLATVAEAKNRGMYVVGHILNQMPLDEQLESGIDEIAHIDEFLSQHWIGYNLGNDPDPTYAEKFDFPPDYEAIPQTVALAAENDIAVLSNLSADEAIMGLILDTESALARPEYDVGRPDLVETWQARGRHKTVFAHAGEQRRDVELPFFMTLLLALHDDGVIIILGSDAGGLIPEGSLPSHIHREVELLVEAGFSNFDALAAGTKNAGIVVRRMGRSGNFGTVVVGQRADLILLADNPLESVSATRERVGVMTNGRWYPQANLDGMLEDHLASLRQ